jgi:hypothetical protein
MILVMGTVAGALALLSGLFPRGLCSHVDLFYSTLELLEVMAVLDLYTSISIYFYKAIWLVDRVKTTIVIDRELWNKFKVRLLEEGVEEVSRAIEEVIREELSEDYIADAIRELLGVIPPIEVKPIKPLVETNAGRVVRELRNERT